MDVRRNSDVHDHKTRHAEVFRAPSTIHRYGENTIRYKLPVLLNDMYDFVEPYLSRPITSLRDAFKQAVINSYSDAECIDSECFSCAYGTRLGFRS